MRVGGDLVNQSHFLVGFDSKSATTLRSDGVEDKFLAPFGIHCGDDNRNLSLKPFDSPA